MIIPLAQNQGWEKQTQSSFSRSKCHNGKKYVSGLERGAEMVSVMVGKWWQDAMESYNVALGRDVMDVEVIYGLGGWWGIVCKQIIDFICIKIALHMKSVFCYSRTEWLTRFYKARLCHPFVHATPFDWCLSGCAKIITCLIELRALFTLQIWSSQYWVCNQIWGLLALGGYPGSQSASHRSFEVPVDLTTHHPPLSSST